MGRRAKARRVPAGEAGIDGGRLKALREAAGISQFALAVQAGMTTTAIWRLESGGRGGRIDSLIRLADALDVSADYLLGRSDSQKRQN